MKEKAEVANMPNTCHSKFESYVLLMCETLKSMACPTQKIEKNAAFFHFGTNSGLSKFCWNAEV